MRITCLCPTYGRPQSVIENSIACFLAQTHEDKELFIVDDTPQRWVGEFIPWQMSKVCLWQSPSRLPSLPAKYNRMVDDLAHDCWPDAVAVWDDDDVYLPHHLKSIDFRLSQPGEAWYQNNLVYSTYTGKILQENSGGRFHGCLAITWDALLKAGGWPDTKRADFDQQMIAKMKSLHPLRGIETYAPSYVFRWADSGASHCQGLMNSPDNEDWYDRVQPQNTEPFVNLAPRFDDSTKAIFAALNIPLPELEGVIA